jgi:hypothetical protein
VQRAPSRRSKTTSAQFQSEAVAKMLTLDEETIWPGRNYGSCIFAVRLVTIGVRFVTEKQEYLVTNILTVDTCRKTKVLLILQHMQGTTCVLYLFIRGGIRSWATGSEDVGAVCMTQTLENGSDNFKPGVFAAVETLDTSLHFSIWKLCHCFYIVRACSSPWILTRHSAINVCSRTARGIVHQRRRHCLNCWMRTSADGTRNL